MKKTFKIQIGDLGTTNEIYFRYGVLNFEFQLNDFASALNKALEICRNTVLTYSQRATASSPKPNHSENFFIFIQCNDVVRYYIYTPTYRFHADRYILDEDETLLLTQDVVVYPYIPK